MKSHLLVCTSYFVIIDYSSRLSGPKMNMQSHAESIVSMHNSQICDMLAVTLIILHLVHSIRWLKYKQLIVFLKLLGTSRAEAPHASWAWADKCNMQHYFEFLCVAMELQPQSHFIARAQIKIMGCLTRQKATYMLFTTSLDASVYNILLHTPHTCACNVK